MTMNFKKILIVGLIICLLAMTVNVEAKHISTLDKHQHMIIHRAEPSHTYEDSNGNPPPHRDGYVTDDEVKGIGQYYNEYNDE